MAVILTIWTIGAIATFGLFMLVDLPNIAAERLLWEENTMPLWALQMSIALSCVALWPLMLVLLAVDFASHLMGDE